MAQSGDLLSSCFVFDPRFAESPHRYYEQFCLAFIAQATNACIEYDVTASALNIGHKSVGLNASDRIYPDAWWPQLMASKQRYTEAEQQRTPALAPPDADEYRKKIHASLNNSIVALTAKFINALPPVMQTYYANNFNPDRTIAHIWLDLDRAYGKRIRSVDEEIENELKGTKCPDNLDVCLHVQNMEALIGRLSSAKQAEYADHKKRIDLFFDTINPQDAEKFRVYFNIDFHDEDTRTWQDLKTALMKDHFRRERQQRITTESSHAPAAFFATGIADSSRAAPALKLAAGGSRLNTSTGDQPDVGGSSVTRFTAAEPPCLGCGIPGHTIAICRKLGAFIQADPAVFKPLRNAKEQSDLVVQFSGLPTPIFLAPGFARLHRPAPRSTKGNAKAAAVVEGTA
jgi:hypothetical protein